MLQLLKWLLSRLRPREVDSNKQYTSEILAILVQQSGAAHKSVLLVPVPPHSLPIGLDTICWPLQMPTNARSVLQMALMPFCRPLRHIATGVVVMFAYGPLQ